MKQIWRRKISSSSSISALNWQNHNVWARIYFSLTLKMESVFPYETSAISTRLNIPDYQNLNFTSLYKLILQRLAIMNFAIYFAMLAVRVRKV
jgi:hypothetical protein